MRPLMLLLLLCSVMALSACGQRGPLYLPDDAPDSERSEQNA